MSLEIRNTRDLINPNTYKMKALIYGLPGTGKTKWASGATNAGFVACETGLGDGLLTIAQLGVDYVSPKSTVEFDQICSGQIFKDKDAVVLDSLSDMTKTFIKDYAISLPRKSGNSPKRSAGVPELDDYGVMGEITRRHMRKLIDQPKHIIALATERYDKPDADLPGSELLIGPDLPGQMFLGSTAMFDLVLRLRTRPALRNPKDAKSRYNQRYFITEQSGPTIAKCRSLLDNKPLLETEEIWDLETGQGSFTTLLNRIVTAYANAVGGLNGKPNDS